MRPSEQENFMEMAWVVSKRATCSRLQVGAVLVDERGRVIGTGRNGAPPGIDHCRHVDDRPCIESLHAEVNAILHSTRSAVGSTLYVTDSPCQACSLVIVSVGIKRVVYDREYRLRDGLDFLQTSGIIVEKYEGKV